MEATTIIEQAIADAITDELGTGPGLAVQELQAIRGLLERPAATAQPATLLSMARDFLRQRFDMSTGQRGLFDESNVKRDEVGRFATKDSPDSVEHGGR